MKLRWKKLLAAPFIFLAAIVVLIEDWLWDDLARLAALLTRLPLLRPVETFIISLPPYPSLAIFGAPSLLLLPVKLAALYFLGHGRPTLGVIIIIAAKFVGTALVARIYTLTEPKLLRIPWFARLHARFVSFKRRVYAAIKASAIYQAAHRLARQLRALLARLRSRGTLWRRWVAARRLSRRGKQSGN